MIENKKTEVIHFGFYLILNDQICVKVSVLSHLELLI